MIAAEMEFRANDWKREEFGSALFWLILACALFIRVAGLWTSRAELFFDEAQYWDWAQQPAFGYFSKPPLIAWLIAGATSLCGDGPFCVRLPSPILYTATAVLVGSVATQLFDRRAGFWAAILFALMPGVSVSAIVMSTDVPLLTAWALALAALARFRTKRDLTSAVVLGLAIGLGLNAKYATAFFFACTAVWLMIDPGQRELARRPGLWLAFGLGTALILPNLAWNYANGFATFVHTANNADWRVPLPDVLGLLEFVAVQAAILSPVPFVAYLASLRMDTPVNPPAAAFLIAFSLPVFAVIMVFALISKANGNWAATAFPAAIILAGTVMSATGWRSARTATVVIGVIALIEVSFSGLLVGRVTFWPIGQELGKLDGWGDLALDIAALAEREGASTIAVEGRGLTASMVYELRNSKVAVRAFMADDGAASDHFELTRPWRPRDGGHVLIVSVFPAKDMPLSEDRLNLVARVPTRVFIARDSGFVNVFHIR